MLSTILFVIAAVLFGIAAFTPSPRPPLHLGWAGATLVAVALAVGG